MYNKQVFQKQHASEDPHSNEINLLKKILFQVFVVQIDIFEFQASLKLSSISLFFVAYVEAKS